MDSLSEPTRYEMFDESRRNDPVVCGMREHPNGHYVRYDDYDALAERLRVVLTQCDHLAAVNHDRLEYLCERCQVVHPPVGHALLQPCPDCRDTMIPSSFNIRELKRLRTQLATAREALRGVLPFVRSWLIETYNDEAIVEALPEIQMSRQALAGLEDVRRSDL